MFSTTNGQNQKRGFPHAKRRVQGAFRRIFDASWRTSEHELRAQPPSEHARTTELTGRMVLGLIVAFFGVIFAVNGVLVHEALSTFGGVETDSSYKAGQQFEGEVMMAKAQEAKHWRVDAKLNAAVDGGAVLDIVARDASGAVLTGLQPSVSFERPTDRRLDRTVAVSEDEPGHFRAPVQIAAGQWDLVIELWRAGQRQFRSINRVILP
jgi:nitrogen fixation protein FixH